MMAKEQRFLQLRTVICTFFVITSIVCFIRSFFVSRAVNLQRSPFVLAPDVDSHDLQWDQTTTLYRDCRFHGSKDDCLAYMNKLWQSSATTERKMTTNTSDDAKDGYLLHWGLARNQRPPIDRVIVYLIDGLRFDAVLWDTDEGESPSNTFKNHCPNMNRMLKEFPQRTALFKFLADPPTATTQRLKGMTTGNFPSFFEIVGSLHPDRLLEDSVVEEIRAHAGPFRIIGDDTWKKIFGIEDTTSQSNDNSGLLDSKSYCVESLNIRDLYTLDHEIRDLLDGFLVSPAEKTGNAKVVAFHVIGVDHAGHVSDVMAPIYADRISYHDAEVNRLASSILSRQEENHEFWSRTLLMVLSDHGMLDDGSHGGSSQKEVEAVLFVASPTELFKEKSHGHPVEDVQAAIRGYTYDTIWQVDIVPSLAALLGVPIPFNSVGAPHPTLVVPPQGESDAEALSRVSRLYVAVGWHTQRLLHFLGAKTGRAVRRQVDKLWLRALESLETVLRISNPSGPSPEESKVAEEALVTAYRSYLQQFQRTFRSLWMQPKLLAAHLSLAIALVVAVYGMSAPLARRKNAVCSFVFCPPTFVAGILGLVAVAWGVLWEGIYVTLTVTVVLTTALLLWIGDLTILDFGSLWKWSTSIGVWNLIAIFVVIVLLTKGYSDMYCIMEAKLYRFLAGTMLLLNFVRLLWRGSSHLRRASLVHVVLLVLLRFSAVVDSLEAEHLKRPTPIVIEDPVVIAVATAVVWFLCIRMRQGSERKVLTHDLLLPSVAMLGVVLSWVPPNWITAVLPPLFLPRLVWFLSLLGVLRIMFSKHKDTSELLRSLSAAIVPPMAVIVPLNRAAGVLVGLAVGFLAEEAILVADLFSSSTLYDSLAVFLPWLVTWNTAGFRNTIGAVPIDAAYHLVEDFHPFLAPTQVSVRVATIRFLTVFSLANLWLKKSESGTKLREKASSSSRQPQEMLASRCCVLVGILGLYPPFTMHQLLVLRDHLMIMSVFAPKFLCEVVSIASFLLAACLVAWL